MNSPVDKNKLFSIKIDRALPLNPTHNDPVRQLITLRQGRSVTLCMPLEAWLDLEEKLKAIDFNE